MSDDIYDELNDLSGDTAYARNWNVRITNVSFDAPIPAEPDDPSQLPQVWTTVKVLSTVGVALPDPLHPDGGLAARDISSGYIVQRLAATLGLRRFGALVGTWLLAVDPNSVKFRVLFPCILTSSELSDCVRPWHIAMTH